MIPENGKYKAIFQEDGNLQVTYKNLSVVWSSNTGNSAANEVHFDQSGNLMILSTSWSTDTADWTPKAETLVMGNDGDLQLLSKDNERVWHSGARMISANDKSIIIVSQSSISKSVMKSRQRQVTCWTNWICFLKTIVKILDRYLWGISFFCNDWHGGKCVLLTQSVYSPLI